MTNPPKATDLTPDVDAEEAEDVQRDPTESDIGAATESHIELHTEHGIALLSDEEATRIAAPAFKTAATMAISDGFTPHVADQTLDNIRLGEVPTRQDSDYEDELGDRIRAHLDKEPKKKKDALIGEVLGGRFVVLKKIGAGGMGAVYRARQEGMDRDVAVKVLLGDLTDNDTVLRRFTLEALAVSRLKHPNTIQIFDYGQTPQGNPYIAMELLEGATLHDVLRKERPLPVRRALRIMAQVASSLSEAHDKGIVHRDLKPENIFLIKVGDNSDFVKVLDFGLAKLREGDDKGTLTQAGSIFGTPRYMSPEQCSAQPVDARSDIYALGVILYEMIVGQAPFNSDQTLSLLLAHVNDPPPPPSQANDKIAVPAEVEEFVLKLLAKLPADRVQKAVELASRCDEMAHQLPTAFDQHLGKAEAEELGVRMLSSHTLDMPTARTMRVGAEAGRPDAPQLVLEQPRNKWLMPLVGLGVIGTAAVIVAAVTGQQPQTERIITKETIKTVTVIADPPEAGMVQVTLTTNPAGAQVIVGGDSLGTTPKTLKYKKDSPSIAVSLVLKGYETQELPIEFGTSQQMHYQLKALPEHAAPMAPVAEEKATPTPRARAKTAEIKAEVKAPPPEIKAPDPKPEPKPEPKVAAKPEKFEIKLDEEKPKPKPKPKKDELVDDLQ